MEERELRKGSLSGPLLGTVQIPAGLAYGNDFVGTVTAPSTALSGFTAVWAFVDPTNALAELSELRDVLRLRPIDFMRAT